MPLSTRARCRLQSASNDVVCTGWLGKLPPEQKLVRYAWKKCWFILRSTQINGNPDVLEYYKNEHSKKSLWIINLNFCKQLDVGLTFNKKELQKSFMFDIKTNERTFYLVAETQTNMNRGQKSKARAREKRRQTKMESRGLEDTHTKAAEKREPPSSSAHASEDAMTSIAADVFSKLFQGMPYVTTFSICIACKRSDKIAKSRRKKNTTRSSRTQHSNKSPQKDLLKKKTGMLMEYMLNKYKQKEPLLREEMLNVVNKSFKEQFPEILKKALNRMDLVFGLEMKEVQPNGQSYMLVSKLDFKDDGSRSSELGLPNRGILIPLLSVIYLNGYCAPEEEVWHFLNMLGVHDGVPHLIFGDIRKLITEELVQEKYLEYRQVPDSDPPSYEFLWGPKAYAEASQVKVMEFLANINETGSSTYPSNYEEALKEEDRAHAVGPAQKSTTCKTKRHSKSKSSLPTC
ncbi:Melanoma-associated antigen B4 [Cricetulus griseus]|uniref:Melanoma-associated antigen B4 n=1 Tax=Cricetulus griseus TaxID=10029 RepID=G3HUF4_CRIGR|nr:Melanoma-associated antigen B4 [Cricetulus griseus]